MRIVVALGGNALLRRGEPAEAATQGRNVLEVASALADLASDHELVITHGNGPQVGLLALEADAYKGVAPYPLDILGAESQGMIGYLLVQALASELPEREVVALLTQVVVDSDDPAFARPTKPIGPVYSEKEARELAAEHGAGRSRGTARTSVVSLPRPSQRLSWSFERSSDSWPQALSSSAAAAAGFLSSRTPEPCVASRR